MKKYSGKIAYNKKVAEKYNEERIVEPVWEKEQDAISSFVKKLPNNCTILDLPVGTGRFLNIYLESPEKNIKVIAGDISEDMLNVAKRNIKSTQNVDFKVCDAENLSEIATGSIDFTLCVRLFHLIPKDVAKQIIKELCRVTNHTVVLQVFDLEITLKRKIAAALKMCITKPYIVALKVVRYLKSNQNQNNKYTDQDKINVYYHCEDDIIKEFEKNRFKKVQEQDITDLDNTNVIFYKQTKFYFFSRR